jgi:Ras-related protein Rab-5C
MRVSMIGPASAGKTSVVSRFAYGRLPCNPDPTVGASFLSKHVTAMGTEVKLEIWDTAGSERYRSLVPMYYREADAAIVVCDVTKPGAVAEAREWVELLRGHAKGDVIVALAANKIDIVDVEHVSEHEIAEFVHVANITVFKLTSALDGTNIDELFQDLADAFIAKTPIADTQTLEDAAPAGPEDRKCCFARG